MAITRSENGGSHLKIVRLIHGFNERRSGLVSTDTLQPYFEAGGFSVIQDDYGWLGIVGVHVANRPLAHMLAEDTKWLVNELPSFAGLQSVEVYGVAHSNGSVIIQQACEYGAPFKQIALINAALDSDAKFAPQVERIHVFHTAWDIPTRIAAFIPLSRWGAMGAIGYRGPDKRVWNYDMNKLFPHAVKRHTAVFKNPENRKVLGEALVSLFGIVKS